MVIGDPRELKGKKILRPEVKLEQFVDGKKNLKISMKLWRPLGLGWA